MTHTVRLIVRLIVLAGLVAMVLAGCTGQSIRYSPYELQDFDPKTQKHIENAETALGMSPQAVRYAWGAPTAVQVKENAEGLYTEEWIYTRARILATRLIFTDGKLVGIVSGAARRNPLSILRGDKKEEPPKEIQK